MKLNPTLLLCALLLNGLNGLHAQEAKKHGFAIAWEQGTTPNSVIIWRKDPTAQDDATAQDTVDLTNGDYILSSPYFLSTDPDYSASMVLVPYRFRLGKEGDTPGRVITGDKNLGVYLPLLGWRRMSLRPGIVTTESDISLGAVIAPFTQEFTSVNNSAITDSDTELQGVLLSTALAVNLRLNGVSLLLCPIGFDWGGGSMAETWNFNENRWWWGFGIGADLRKISSLIPKFKG